MMIEKTNIEARFLNFFDSVQMVGWKELSQLHLYWKAKKLSAFFIFLACFLQLSHELLPDINELHMRLIWAFFVVLPGCAIMGWSVYFMMDKFFDKFGGNGIALNHVSRTWSHSKEAILEILQQCDKDIISEQDKQFLHLYPYEKNCVHILHQAWKKAIYKEVVRKLNAIA